MEYMDHFKVLVDIAETYGGAYKMGADQGPTDCTRRQEIRSVMHPLKASSVHSHVRQLHEHTILRST